VKKAAARKARDGAVMSDDERMRLVSTDESLRMDDQPRLPSNSGGLENFSLTGAHSDDDDKPSTLDADTLFNLPDSDDEDDDDLR